MRDVISEFKSEIEGSLAFCALMLFLCSIVCLMCSGSSLHEEVPITFWAVVFVCVENDVCEDGVCMSGGARMSEKVASVSVVNCVQFAFL